MNDRGRFRGPPVVVESHAVGEPSLLTQSPWPASLRPYLRSSTLKPPRRALLLYPYGAGDTAKAFRECFGVQC